MPMIAMLLTEEMWVSRGIFEFVLLHFGRRLVTYHRVIEERQGS